jgi:5-(carboxyamino)imidazole ribonucleotide synthase
MSAVVLPGATIGILGGGQLGRMLALAAKPMGYRIAILDPDPECPAWTIADAVLTGEFDNPRALEALAKVSDVVTLEFENVPSDGLALLEELVPVRPRKHVLETVRDRALEKSFINSAGVETAPWAAVNNRDDLEGAAQEVGFPAILKTATLGYDGKGQARVASPEKLREAFAKFNQPCVLEGLVDFEREISVIVARSSIGEVRCFPVFENRHVDGILDVTTIPAKVSAELKLEAERIAQSLAAALEVVGLLCVEMFVTRTGDLLVNELAPRPHNSGHLTIEACPTSQFEQAIRAVCGLKLGEVAPHGSAAMVNLLGDLWQSGEPNWLAGLAGGAKLHLYGKKEPRPGRKMGHITAFGDDALGVAISARAALMDRG